MKDFLKNLINLKLIIIVTLIITGIILFFASAAYVINILDATNSNYIGTNSWNSIVGNNSENYNFNMPAQLENSIISQITSSNIVAKGNGDYKLNIDLDEQINDLYEKFNEKEEGRRILDYLTGTEEEKKEFLKNIARAEIATQYPDLRNVANMGSDVESNEVQGVIQFKRKISQEIKKVESINKATSTSLELTGIACWGDDFTLGNSDDNYPTKLASLLSTNAYNLGFQEETAEEILLRAGAEGYVFETMGESFTIGAELGAEAIFSAQMKTGTRSIGAVFKYCDGSEERKKLKCVINGVQGELTYVDGKYRFRRTVEGTEITIGSGTEIKIESQGGYNECIPIIWIGNNNSKFSINEGELQKLITYYKDFINELDNPDDYLIIIPLYYKDANGEQQEYSNSEYDYIKSRLVNAFNNKCLDLKGEGWTVDLGYASLANIIKEKLATLGFNIGRVEQQQGVGEIRFGEIIPFGEEITLEYIPLGNSLQPEPGTLRWLIEQEDEDIKNAALQFFSIDASGNIIIAKWNRTTTIVTNYTNETVDGGYPTTNIEYILTTLKVNYKSSISKYTMPADYLWALLVMGEDTEFVQNIANLALDSEIEATLYDELTIIETNNNESHTDESKTEVSETTSETPYHPRTGLPIVAQTRTSTRNFTENEVSTTYRNNTYVKTETSKVKYMLTKADVWCLKYTVEGVLGDWHVEETQESTTTIPDEEWQPYGEERQSNTSRSVTDVDGNIIGEINKSRTEQDYRRTINQSTTVTIDQRAYNYNSGSTQTLEKTSKEATTEEISKREFNEPNFVKYYLYSETAKDKIFSIYSWLIESLELNSKTAEMVDITKYMIYKATENDLGVTDMDFSSYNNSDFQNTDNYYEESALGQVELDGSYNVNGVLLSNPIVDPISFVGSYSNHGAVDINPTQNGGTPVYAAADGTVSIATYHISYGNYVLISHTNGVSTLYAHAQSLVVSKGQTVKKGQLIMYEGSTGNSSGPHVHFEIRINGTRNQSLAEDMFRQLGFRITYNY